MNKPKNYLTPEEKLLTWDKLSKKLNISRASAFRAKKKWRYILDYQKKHISIDEIAFTEHYEDISDRAKKAAFKVLRAWTKSSDLYHDDAVQEWILNTYLKSGYIKSKKHPDQILSTIWNTSFDWARTFANKLFKHNDVHWSFENDMDMSIEDQFDTSETINRLKPILQFYVKHWAEITTKMFQIPMNKTNKDLFELLSIKYNLHETNQEIIDIVDYFSQRYPVLRWTYANSGSIYAYYKNIEVRISDHESPTFQHNKIEIYPQQTWSIESAIVQLDILLPLN